MLQMGQLRVVQQTVDPLLKAKIHPKVMTFPKQNKDQEKSTTRQPDNQRTTKLNYNANMRHDNKPASSTRKNNKPKGSETFQQKTKISVLGDSIIKALIGSKMYSSKSVYVKSFSEATTSDMKHYIVATLGTRPNKII